MAYIEVRVSGVPKVHDGKPRRVRKTFRDTTAGRAAKAAFAAGLSDVTVKYDLRYKVNDRLVTEKFDTKGEATRYKDEIGTERANGHAVDPAGGRITLDGLFEQWLSSNPGKRSSTRAQDRASFARCTPTFRQLEIRHIRQPAVQAEVNGWGETLAPRTVRRTYGTLRAVFAYAVDVELIRRSPCRKVSLPKVAPNRAKCLSMEHVAAVADVIDPTYRPMVWVAALLGLRWGEVAALRVSSIDLPGRLLTVSEAVGRNERGGPVLGAPKSHAAYRTLTTAKFLTDALASHIATTGLSTEDSEAFLFPAPSGLPWSYGNFRTRVWEPATAKAGLKGFGFHDLRRIAATALVRGNVDLKTAGTRLGHSNPSLTLELYAQATREGDREAADAVEDQYADLLGRGDRDRIATIAHDHRSAVA
jgi:integrase